MNNPLAFVFIGIGLYMTILGFRNRQGNLIAAFTGREFGGLSSGNAQAVGGAVGDAAVNMTNAAAQQTHSGGGRPPTKE